MFHFERWLPSASTAGTRGLDFTRLGMLDMKEVHACAKSHLESKEEAFTQAIEIYKHTGSSLGRANALKGLGDAKLGRLKYTEAEEIFTQAIKIYKRFGSDLGRANALKGLGDVTFGRLKHAEDPWTLEKPPHNRTKSRTGVLEETHKRTADDDSTTNTSEEEILVPHVKKARLATSTTTRACKIGDEGTVSQYILFLMCSL